MGDMGGYGGSRCRELVCALAMWISLRHSVSLFLTLPMDQTNYLDLKCSNLKCHHDSETAAEKFCSFENSPASPAFKKRGKDLNRRIAKRQNCIFIPIPIWFMFACCKM